MNLKDKPVEEILPGIYRIEIPLPKNPLRALNAYVLKGTDRNLIIDTGWNHEDCMSAMLTCLRKTDVNLSKTDFFITHLHADHIGLVSALAQDNSTIYFNEPEADKVSVSAYWEEFRRFARQNGFPKDDIRTVFRRHPGYKYGPRGPLSFCLLKENDRLTIGDYIFKCIETPGHSIGHLCLYEPSKKLLISGDHVLQDITPNIQLWSDGRNTLKQYIRSLKKVEQLDVDLVLPGHRRIFTNCRKRVLELRAHHQHRLKEVMSILENGELQAYQVASRMAWDISEAFPSWDEFPPPQKWFATGEAISHLKYLEEEGRIQRRISEQRIFFSLK
ncbi:MAG: MBL fold metallo-hydrolase [Deltaproteobacteria bacterium]|nr:MBL fold metallo-hydrolase [Deltaproteobacteria bacterium]